MLKKSSLSILLALLICISSVSAVYLKDGLLYYWGLQSSGIDFSPNDFDLSPTGNITYTSGVIGNAVHCDNNDYLSGVNKPLPVNSFTVNGWQQIHSVGNSWYAFVSRIGAGGYANPIDIFWSNEATDRFRFNYGNATAGDSVDYNYALTNGLNHFIMWTMTRNSSGVYQLWMDGELVVTKSDPTQNIVDDSSRSFRICERDDGVVYLDGEIDEVAIWNRTLNQSEILALNNSGLGLNYSEFLSYSDIDSQIPYVTIKSPINNSQFADDMTVNYTANFSDIEQHLNWYNLTWINENGQDNISVIQSFSATQKNQNSTYLRLTEGIWRLRVNARDSSNNFAMTEFTYNITTREKLDSEILRETKDLSNSINEVLDMLPMVLLYAIFMVLGYYMIYTGNWLSGWSLYSISIGFDFLFAGWIRDKYIPVILQNYAGSFSGSMTFIFLAFLFVWISAKILTLLVFNIKVWKT